MRRLWRGYVHTVAFKERALRAMMPSRMRFVHYSWPLRAELCPCDLHFCQYLRERDLRHKSIFHFGTGGHHMVGTQNHLTGAENDILGLTVSPKEHNAYVNEVIHNPALGRHYKVLFADIYSLSAGCLPTFDIVSLFHLCEFADEGSAGRRLDDSGVLDLFLSKTHAGGLLLFYPRSYGYRKVQPSIERAVDAKRLEFVEDYQSLSIYRVTDSGASAA